MMSSRTIGQKSSKGISSETAIITVCARMEASTPGSLPATPSPASPEVPPVPAGAARAHSSASSTSASSMQSFAIDAACCSACCAAATSSVALWPKSPARPPLKGGSAEGVVGAGKDDSPHTSCCCRSHNNPGYASMPPITRNLSKATRNLRTFVGGANRLTNMKSHRANRTRCVSPDLRCTVCIGNGKAVLRTSKAKIVADSPEARSRTAAPTRR
mmetsp:Transcript_96290/g.249467  ORF Transcript_96290/g.249467 Transcript_96290/m.249467 type:complete len:216 (-) Transcript_96290:2531-3178(-)